jgi:hypothetical protein
MHYVSCSSFYGVHAATPGVTAGGGGAAVPMKMEQLRAVAVLVATAAQPVVVTLDKVTVTFWEGP